MLLEMDAAVAEGVAATGHTAGTLRINTLGMAARRSSHRGSAGFTAQTRMWCSTS